MAQEQNKTNWRELAHSKEFRYIFGGIVLVVMIFVIEIAANCYLRSTVNAVRPEDVIAVSTAGWGDQYFEYLDQIVKNKHPEDDKVNLANMQNAMVSLYYQTGWSSPVMVIAYHSTLNDKDYTTFIAPREGGGELAVLNLPDQYDVRHYYNMLDQSANYYTIESGVNPAFSCFVPLTVRVQQGSGESDVDGAICTLNADSSISSPTNKAARYLFDEAFVPLTEIQNSFRLTADLSTRELRKSYDELTKQLGIIQARTNQELTQLSSKITAARERVSAQRSNSGQ